MDIIGILDRLQSLEEEARKLHDEVSEKVVAAAQRYINAFRKNSYGWPGSAATYSWHVADDLIDVSWDEHWNYGGEDSGSFEFPIEFVWDEDALIQHEKATAAEIERKKKEKEAECEKKERQRLQELSDKYPE